MAELRPEQFQGFWYFPSSTNFALISSLAALLWSTSIDAEERQFYRTKIPEYRWTLEVSSKSTDMMDLAIEILDSSTASLRDYEFNNRDSVSPTISRDSASQLFTPMTNTAAGYPMVSMGSQMDFSGQLGASHLTFDGVAPGGPFDSSGSYLQHDLAFPSVEHMRDEDNVN